MAIEDSQLANFLRNKILRPFQTQKTKNGSELSELEMVSQNEIPYVSPIMTMSEDEMVAFIEEFDVRELATLSDEELNRMSEVLGVDPKNLVEGED